MGALSPVVLTVRWQPHRPARPPASKEPPIEPSDEYFEPPGPRGEAHASGAIEAYRGIIARWRKRRAQRKRARLVSPRNRRVLAQWLRRTATRANDRDPIRRRRDVLLHYRAAAVRPDLLEIAALLEQASDPDPTCVKEIHRLLAIGDSPLYCAGVHVSELYATLYYIRAGLAHDHASAPAGRPDTTNHRPTARDRPDAPRREGTES